MTLQEAIDSGRPFRRKCSPYDHVWYEPEMLTHYRFHVSDIRATNWEVKPAEPVVFESTVWKYHDWAGCVSSETLIPLINKRVRVTVEEIE